MAAPVTLARWRAYVAHDLGTKPALTMDEIADLTPDEKRDYDDSRFRWMKADNPVETPHVKEFVEELRLLNPEVSAGVSAGVTSTALGLSGPSGLGKSTMALTAAKQYDAKQRSARGHDPNFQPTVYFRVPPGATPKILMKAVATTLGLPVRYGADAAQITSHVITVLESMETSLVIFDEVHELKSGSTGSSMKQFVESLDASFILAGVNLAESHLFTGELGAQMAGRLGRIDLAPFGYGNAGQRDTWASIVAGIENTLPLALHAPGDLYDDTAYLHARTGGSIGALKNLFMRSASTAIRQGSEKIDRTLLDQVRGVASADDSLAERSGTALTSAVHQKAG